MSTALRLSAFWTKTNQSLRHTKLVDSLRYLLSDSCLLCNYPVSATISLCETCQSNLPRLGPSCERCGIALSGESITGVCGHCILDPPAFNRCHAPFHYRFPIDKLITDFKYHGNFASGRALGRLLAEDFHCYYSDNEESRQAITFPELLIPVPLHSRKLRSRGFNQASLLTRTLSQHTGIPINDQLITRTRQTEPQSQLHSQQRSANLVGAFQLTRALMKPDVTHVAIIDDVVTTTATANAVAKTLQNTNVEQIDIWSIARA